MSDAENFPSRTAPSRAIHLRVTGRVQGVYFRAWASELAARLELDGWVGNRRDGSVELLVSGSADADAQMLESCRSGPPDAQVEAVEILDERGKPAQGFLILPTA